MEKVELTAVIHEAPDGSLWAEVTELPGCFASGFSLDELQEALVEAVSMCLEHERPEAVRGAEGESGHRPGIRLDEMKLVVEDEVVPV